MLLGEEVGQTVGEGRSVPFFNYPALFQSREKEILEVVTDVMSRGAYILQKDLADFENNLKKFLGVRHAFGVADGTNALILALRATGIGPGHEVILPSHTYIATAAAVHFVGATPVLVECGSDHMIDPDSVAKAVTSRSRAIVPVQLNGRTCDMDALGTIAERHRLIIVEDSAQGLGSRFKGRGAGTFGAAGTFSFYPAKLLGCFGDGGAVVTNDDGVAEQLTLLRDHGRNADGEVVAWGTNCRLDNLQAAILDLKLKTFDDDIRRRRQIAAMYRDGLSGIDDLVLPAGPDDGPHFDVYQNYEIESGSRDSLQAYLAEHGVGTIIQWGGRAVHQFRKLGFEGVTLPFTERMFTRCMMLPLHTALSDEDVQYVCDRIRAFYSRRDEAWLLRR